MTKFITPRYNPFKSHSSLRLKNYDYSQNGAYFITITTYKSKNLLGRFVGEEVVLNRLGKAAWRFWNEIPQHYPHIILDEFVVMPNHVHGILVIDREMGGVGSAGARNIRAVEAQHVEPVQYKEEAIQYKNKPLQHTNPPQNQFQKIIPGSIGCIIRGFKSAVTKYGKLRTQNQITWHKNYYEHVIRNEKSLNQIRQYIINNPLKLQLKIKGEL